MNDTRFKELINLYLDHRLSAAEARELERAMQENPALRRTFRSYTLMHQGCAELFRRSASDAPAPDALVQALREAESRMRAKSERRATMLGWGSWGATAGVAAIVALVVARISQPTAMVAEAGPETNLDGGVTTALAAVENRSSPALVLPAVSRRALPEHLTLAALGIAPERGEESSLSRWQAAEDTAVRLASSTVEIPSWMQSASSAAPSAWTGGSATVAPFSARPINAWGGQTSAAQFQTASFTFER